jgi:hypothetical protein
LEVTRDAGNPHDPVVGASKGELVGQTPTLDPRRIEVELETLDDRDPRCQDPEVLVEKSVSEWRGKDFLRGATQEFVLTKPPTAHDQGLVDHDIAALSILDEKDHVRNAVEESFGERRGLDEGVEIGVHG